MFRSEIWSLSFWLFSLLFSMLSLFLFCHRSCFCWYCRWRRYHHHQCHKTRSLHSTPVRIQGAPIKVVGGWKGANTQDFKHKDISTYRLNQSRGQFSENLKDLPDQTTEKNVFFFSKFCLTLRIFLVLVLLSALVKRYFVSRMRHFYFSSW